MAKRFRVTTREEREERLAKIIDHFTAEEIEELTSKYNSEEKGEDLEL